ncbi:deoxycytidylate deaminase [Mycobacterium phage Wile]|uniref:dCMP deaminase n=1 Tax=Mycobacterium phage Wile TaxID=1056833 RepID=UPI00021C4B45|nr:dCMP deaminase [Mycobacterium phage Wile]AEL19923.1 deoxycytidylate deaminase [Mycobacterium phage Wile]
MRPDWDEYFLGIASAAAERSDCERSKVGAVVVKDRRVRATGYNGAPAGRPGCGTCPRRTSNARPGVDSYSSGGTRCVAVHAEANALLYCDREDLRGASLYITRAPCGDCSKLIDAAGIERVVYPFEWEKPEGCVCAGPTDPYHGWCDPCSKLPKIVVQEQDRWERNEYTVRMEPGMLPDEPWRLGFINLRDEVGKTIE